MNEVRIVATKAMAFRLGEEAANKLEEMSKKYGMSKTQIITLLITKGDIEITFKKEK